MFVARTRMAADRSQLRAWHMSPGALERLLPGWNRAQILERPPVLVEGSQVVLSVPIGPFRVRWVARHEGIENPDGFRDIQQRGPFGTWIHEHRFLPADRGESILEDRIVWELPFGALGRLAGGSRVQAQLERMFRHRHAVLAADLESHRRFNRKLDIAVSGASGLVGSTLVAALSAGGHRVRSIVRRPSGRADEILWDPVAGRIDGASLEGVDAVVNLAGENIAGGRWTAERKARIRASRVDGTALIARTLAGLDRRPEVLVTASAVGYYGDRGAEKLDETSRPGAGFLAGTCVDWEAATAAARTAGIRVVQLRIGIVLTPGGGVLARSLPLFGLGLGGALGSGAQYMSWIAREDLIGVLLRALADVNLDGPVNAVAPASVTNREFTRVLARVLRRPAVLPAPAPALRLALGREMADELLLASTRVLPARLVSSGFSFRFPDIESALRFELGKMGAGAASGTQVEFDGDP